MGSASMDSHRSSYREAMIEHLFVGELMRVLWCAGVVAEILKPEVDNAGYDIVMEANGVLRHIQMKSTRRRAKTARQNVNTRLEEKPGGCVVWVLFDPHDATMGPFLWFGSDPGYPLRSLKGFKVARQTRGDASGHKGERPEIRVVPKSEFKTLDTVEEVIEALFGLTAAPSAPASGVP